MLHIFHKWGVVGTKLMVKLDSTHYTLVLYQCTNPKCIELKTEELPGHWKQGELGGDCFVNATE